MLTQQFFTRSQLAKILNFKRDGSIKDLEKKGFLTPQIKPSKYSFNQVLFMMICKEIIDSTDLSWKYFIDFELNAVLKNNLIDHDILVLSYQFRNRSELSIELINDNIAVNVLNDYLDGPLVKLMLQFKKEFGLEEVKSTPSFDVRCNKNYTFLIFSISRVYQKLHYKCIELGINLKDKY